MNSKGVTPRVGMQVTINWCTGDERKRISKLSPCHYNDTTYITFDNGSTSTADHFMEGAYEIEWAPPSRVERRMLRKAAAHEVADEARRFCFWYNGESDHFNAGKSDCSRIAESLAMDGL